MQLASDTSNQLDVHVVVSSRCTAIIGKAIIEVSLVRLLNCIDTNINDDKEKLFVPDPAAKTRVALGTQDQTP